MDYNLYTRRDMILFAAAKRYGVRSENSANLSKSRKKNILLDRDAGIL